MKKYLSLIVLYLCLAVPNWMYATHVVGGVITYAYNGTNTYTVTLKLYRDCGAGTASLNNSYVINIAGLNGANPTTLTLPRVSLTNLTSPLDPCAIPPNPMPCVQEGVYTATVSLPPVIGGYHLWIGVFNRNFSIDNITNPGGTGEGLYAYIPGLNNNGANFIPNSDPVFSAFPPLFVCQGKPFTFNHSATDADSDVLVYSLYQPYNGSAPTYSNNIATFPTVTYLGGYSPSNPLGGVNTLSINPTTGVLSGTPPALGQYVVGIKVEEYRNGVLIGYTIRDFQFNVVNCPTPPPAISVTNVVVNNGCSNQIVTTGITPASATWTSILPGAAGTYNNFLSCTSGCLTPSVTSIGTPPAFVDYKVCGVSLSCSGANVCDTVRVTFNPTLSVSIQPSNPNLCFGQTSTTITAVGSGGTPPYIYLWNNVNPSQTINVGVGTYNIKLTDASGCPAAFNSVIVTSFSVPITANAGPDKTVCKQTPVTSLTGTITGATGGIWSGGTGTFSPSNTTLLNMQYTPSAAELAAGSTTLTLTSTGNLNCPSNSDVVVINYSNFTATLSSSITNVGCFGSNTGSVTITPTLGITPYTYTWSTTPIQNSQTATGLTSGTYSVSIKDGIGCITQTVVTVTQPTSAVLVSGTITPVTCNGSSTGSINVLGNGGTAPYTYSWSPGAQTTPSITNLPIGSYSVKVTDAKSCTVSATYNVTQPAVLNTVATKTNVLCFGGNTGIGSVAVSGGVSPYTYSWTASSANMPTVGNLVAGTYSVKVTDAKGCTSTKTITIGQPLLLLASITVTNELCDYSDNGRALATVSGGTGPYTYTWQPTAIDSGTNTISNLASGVYSLAVTDSKGCVTNTIATITQPLPLTPMLSNVTNVSCFGGANASMSASGNGGTPNYTYSWLPTGATTATVGGLTVGNYTLIVTDSKLCTTQTVITVSQPTAALTTTATVVNVSCFNGSNGSITSIPSGGTSPYTYSWLNTGATTQSISSLPIGNYTVNVTDVKNCSAVAVFVVAQPSALGVAFSTTNTTCSNLNNGAISATISGGTTSYSYSWSPANSNSPNILNLAANTYTLKVTDAMLCVLIETVTITKPAPLLATVSVTNETCNQLNNGLAIANVTGGTPVYTYTFLPSGVNTNTVNNLSSGTQTVLVRDANNCSFSKTFLITQPSVLNATITSVTNVKCYNGTTGKATGLGFGGTAPYTYMWAPSGSTLNTISNVADGSYTLTVTDSKSCTAQVEAIITQPDSLETIITTTNVTCFGGNNGQALISNIGGTPGYTNTLIPGNISANSFTNLTIGTYTINSKDSKGCLNKALFTLTQPSSVVSAITVTNSNCGQQNGFAEISITSGGTAPYTYSWSPSGGTNSLTTNIFAGGYNCKITDALGCISFTNANILDIGAPVVSIVSTTNVACFGELTGAVTASFTGGAGPIFTQTWSPSGGNNLTTSGVASGIYTIRVTDNFGCIGVATTTLISQPTQLFTTLSTTNVSCFNGTNGSASASVVGGSPGYTYSWSPSGVTTSTINNLALGIYTLEVTDTHTCVSTNTFAIVQPTAALGAVVTSNSVTCFGSSTGTVSANATGGTGPYNYTITPGNNFGPNYSNIPIGNYTVSIKDNNDCVFNTTTTVIQATEILLTKTTVNSDCSLANGQATVNATGGTNTYVYTWSPIVSPSTFFSQTLLAGNYSVVVTDAASCSKSVTLAINDNPAPTISVSSVTNVSCFGANNASATATVTGGTPAYTYTWLPSGGNSATGINLSTGVSTVQVTSGNGCLISAVTPIITEPLALATTVTQTNVSCFGINDGKIATTVVGGTSAYSYSWTPIAPNSPSVTNVIAGIYTVTVTDNLNCKQTTTIQVTQPASLTVTGILISNVNCFGNASGSASVSVAGGTQGYNYSWTPTGGNSPFANGLTANTYSVIINDAHGCTTNTVFAITQPTAALTTSVFGTGVSCFGGSNGSASVTVNGGTSGYTYSWSLNTSTTDIASNYLDGNYVVTVRDAKNCVAIEPFTIAQATPITGSLTLENAECGLPNGSLTAQIIGGTLPYTYAWSASTNTTDTHSNIIAGGYTVTVKDDKNCVKSFSSNVLDLPGQSVNIASSSSVTCFGFSDGSASISITQGTAPYSISWLPTGGNTLTATALASSIYSAVVTDDKGCVVTKTVNINQPASALVVSSATVSDVLCNSGNTGKIVITATGGNSQYTYSWTPNASTTNTASALAAGLYTVFVKDGNNCATSHVEFVNEPTPLTSTILAVNNPVCFNTDGNATVFVNGGIIPYVYSWNTSPTQSVSTVTGIKAGNYNVTITDANGCNITNSLTLNQPTQIITSSPVNDTICIGQVATLNATASGGSGAPYSFAWFPAPPPPVSQINGGALATTPTANISYTVVGFDINGCAGIEDEVKAVVYDLKQSQVTAFGDSPICPNGTSVVYGEITGNTGPVVISWSHGLGNTTGPFVVAPSAPTNYTFTVTSPACGITVSDVANVLFNPPPTAQAIANASTVCAPGAISFTDQSVPGNPNDINDQLVQWLWTFGDGTTSAEQNPKHIYSTDGTFTVGLTVITDKGCKDFNSGVYVVTSYPRPIASFTVNKTVLELPYDKIICTNTSSLATMYNWSFGDGSTATSVNPQYLYTTVGNYNIQLVAFNNFGCTDTANVEIKTNADVVFPNVFTPNLNGGNDGTYDIASLENDVFFPYTSGVVKYSLQIFNRWGELIFESNDLKIGWDGYYRGKMCPLGVYVWKADIKLNDGKVFNKAGDVTLLR